MDPLPFLERRAMSYERETKRKLGDQSERQHDPGAEIHTDSAVLSVRRSCCRNRCGHLSELPQPGYVPGTGSAGENCQAELLYGCGRKRRDAGRYERLCCRSGRSVFPVYDRRGVQRLSDGRGRADHRHRRNRAAERGRLPPGGVRQRRFSGKGCWDTSG